MKDKGKDPVEEASEESFPASDPPAWTAGPTIEPKPTGARKTRLARIWAALSAWVHRRGRQATADV